MRLTYDPKAYVPGGSTRRVAEAIQRRGGWRKPVVGGRPPFSVTPGASVNPVDPLIDRANTVAGQLYAPLLEKLGAARRAGEANAQAAYGVHASALEKALQGTAAPVSQAFGKGVASAAVANDALANRLNNVGTVESGNLAAKLAQINASPDGAAELTKSYQGASNAGFAWDTADLQHLLGRKAEAESYQGKLPGIARLTANQDLQSALSEQRRAYAQQENEYNTAAVNQAGKLYGDFKAEEAQAKRDKQEMIRQTQELAAREKASLRALAAAAVTTAEKNAYKEQEKALDRQLKWDIANLNANTRIATDNPPAASKPPAVASAPNRKFNPDGTPNKNYVPPSGSPGKQKTTPKYVVDSVWNSVNAPYNETSFRWPQEIYNKIKGSPKQIDNILNSYLNNQISAYNLESGQADRLRRSVLKKLNGRKWRDNSGAIWTYEYGGS